MTDPPTPPPEVAACRAAYIGDSKPDRRTEKAAVKTVLAELVALAPGHSVEVRVPPYAAVQVVAGVRHRRGTPPALVQLDARTIIGMAVGDLTWADAVTAGRLRASGERSDLAGLFPLWPCDL